VVVALLRLLLVILAVQASGVPHVLADAFVDHEEAADAGDGDQCPDDENGMPCPPGCPTCHCGSTQAPVVPPATAVMAAPLASISSTARAVDDCPASPPSQSLYRPPRA